MSSGERGILGDIDLLGVVMHFPKPPMVAGRPNHLSGPLLGGNFLEGRLAFGVSDELTRKGD